LISENKNIETTLFKFYQKIVKHPSLLYLIIGKNTSEVIFKKNEGEKILKKKKLGNNCETMFRSISSVFITMNIETKMALEYLIHLTFIYFHLKIPTTIP
jgi:hypothetical protein